MVAVNDSVGRAVFHLDCDPAGGDIRQATKACSALQRNPSLVTKPKPFSCYGGTFSWWDVRIDGRLQGKPLSRHLATCWTPQMATIAGLRLTWGQLRAHLVKRRRGGVQPGRSTTFPPGVLLGGDLVACVIGDHDLELGIPAQGTSSTGLEAGVATVGSVTLTVSRNADGSVHASCHVGRS
jgi:hypothetical protein